MAHAATLPAAANKIVDVFIKETRSDVTRSASGLLSRRYQKSIQFGETPRRAFALPCQVALVGGRLDISNCKSSSPGTSSYW